MIRVVFRGAVLFILSTFCFGVYAQTDPSVKVVVISLGGDEAAKEKVIFITKDRFNGNLGGLSGADAKCQADADALDSKVKGKTFKAWLGPATDPLFAGGRSFNVFDLPYETPDGAGYITSYSDLTTPLPWPFLAITANGSDVSDSRQFDNVWTGRGYSGELLPGTSSFCANWTSSNSLLAFVFLEHTMTGYDYFTIAQHSECSATARIICLEQ